VVETRMAVVNGATEAVRRRRRCACGWKGTTYEMFLEDDAREGAFLVTARVQKALVALAGAVRADATRVRQRHGAPASTQAAPDVVVVK